MFFYIFSLKRKNGNVMSTNPYHTKQVRTDMKIYMVIDLQEGKNNNYISFNNGKVHPIINIIPISMITPNIMALTCNFSEIQ